MIRVSCAKTEGNLQVSKWLKVQVLLDTGEMQALLEELGAVQCALVSEPVSLQDAAISPAVFLTHYARYVDLLKAGQVPRHEEFRRYFSSAVSSTLEPFYAMPAGGERYLIRPVKPVIQLQAHHFFYSTVDHKFHPMTMGQESISWGIQFSYPQLFLDPRSGQIVKVADTPEFPNSALFSRLMRWMRSHTLPTPFEVSGTRTNSPIRIGRQSGAWIKNHIQLQEKGIVVQYDRSSLHRQ